MLNATDNERNFDTNCFKKSNLFCVGTQFEWVPPPPPSYRARAIT